MGTFPVAVNLLSGVEPAAAVPVMYPGIGSGARAAMPAITAGEYGTSRPSLSESRAGFPVKNPGYCRYPAAGCNRRAGLRGLP